MIRVGLIGLGFGSAVQLPAFRAIPGAQVVALGGQRVEKARELAAASGIAIGGSADDVLAADLDAVSIALPPAAGAAVAKRALSRGLAVLAEKPLAEDAVHATALALAARDCTTAVDFQLAEMDCFQELKRRITEADVEFARMSWKTRSFAHAMQRWSWKTDAKQHGGVMSLLGSHVFFLAEWLFGRIQTISANYSYDNTLIFTPAGEVPAEDRAVVKVVFSSGHSMDMELDNAAGGIGQRWEVGLRGGSLFLVEEGPGLLRLEDGRERAILARDASPRSEDWRIKPFHRLAKRFIECAERKAICTPNFDAGARVQVLLDAAKRSAQLLGEPSKIE